MQGNVRSLAGKAFPNHHQWAGAVRPEGGAVNWLNVGPIGGFIPHLHSLTHRPLLSATICQARLLSTQGEGE